MKKLWSFWGSLEKASLAARLDIYVGTEDLMEVFYEKIYWCDHVTQVILVRRKDAMNLAKYPEFLKASGVAIKELLLSLVGIIVVEFSRCGSPQLVWQLPNDHRPLQGIVF